MNVTNYPLPEDSISPDGFELIDLDQKSQLPFLKTAEIIGGYLAPSVGMSIVFES